MADEFTVGVTTTSLEDGETPKKLGDKPAKKGKLLRPIPDVDDPEHEGEIDEPGHRAVANEATRLWESQQDHLSRELAQWQVNSARRQGVTNAKLRYDSIDDHWTAWFPRSMGPDTIPGPKKAARLCRRFVSMMLVDPPSPIVEPPSGDDEDEERAEFSTRALVELQNEANLATVEALEEGLDLSSDFGSGFIRYFVDPRGGGRVPIRVKAGKDPESGERAEELDMALQRHVMEPVIDPVLQQPVPDMDADPTGMTPMMQPAVDPVTGEPAMEDWPEYEERMVTEDRRLTDDEAEAARKWAPSLKREVLTGRNVRPIPYTATDIWDAKGAQIGVMLPWSKVKELYPRLGKMPKEQREKIFGYRPKESDKLFPDVRFDADTKGNEDARLVFVLITYYEMNEADGYPDGLYLVTCGNTYVAERTDWSYDNDETGQKEKLILPISQIYQWREGRQTFYRVGLMELIGSGDELRAAQIAGLLDHLDKVNNRKLFLPHGSTVKPNQMQLPRASTVYFNPQGKPEWEDIPDYPSASMEMFGLAGQEMDEDSGLLETAQAGQQAESGRHLYGIISQVHAGLSQPRRAIERAYTRCCRIELQLARAFLTVPQQMKWKGEDGKYQHRAWMGADLVSSNDVRVKPGTLTMLSPAAKAQFTEHLYAELQIITQQEAREMITTNVGGLIGLQDDPFRMRIRSQLSDWAEGPPDGWQPLPPQVVAVDPVTGQQQPVDPAQVEALAAQGAPLQEVPAPDPDLLEIFDPLPADELPHIAAQRLDEIARFMCGHRFRQQPPGWQQGVIQEFQRMQMASQPPMPVEGEAGGGEEGGGQPPGPEGIPNDPKAQEGVPPEMSL